MIWNRNAIDKVKITLAKDDNMFLNVRFSYIIFHEWSIILSGLLKTEFELVSMLKT